MTGLRALLGRGPTDWAPAQHFPGLLGTEPGHWAIQGHYYSTWAQFTGNGPAVPSPLCRALGAVAERPRHPYWALRPGCLVTSFAVIICPLLYFILDFFFRRNFILNFICKFKMGQFMLFLSAKLKLYFGLLWIICFSGKFVVVLYFGPLFMLWAY